MVAGKIERLWVELVVEGGLGVDSSKQQREV